MSYVSAGKEYTRDGRYLGTRSTADGRDGHQECVLPTRCGPRSAAPGRCPAQAFRRGDPPRPTPPGVCSVAGGQT
ncbi:hypothetical protein [Streptomyces sp. NBC_01244]|uniref:hypothetical protein n=1 Tax=Streptomyces sp. NBC_01244 TaxID=2903797 RepID=UPI002E1141F6|nr:hypothetical protein OG247_03715 [Streptomyces sp. NBC_01244]